VVNGPDTGGPPRLPLTVTAGKVGGTNPGFFAKDATGRKFVIKFDPKHDLELQTAAGVIGNRFFWAMGYNVPSDHVFWLRKEDLRIANDAKAENEVNEKEPFTAETLDTILGSAPQLPDGKYRASSSQFLDGIPKGGFASEGTRSDDPNDVVPHEHRRELRGLKIFAAWLDHTDMKEDNGLDMYVTEGGRSFLKHYLIDFGETLGGHAAEKGRLEDGYEHWWDWSEQSKALFSFGLWERPWESRQPSGFTSVGPVPSAGWDPKHWKEAYPYWPFFDTDAADAYWAAKIVMRFDRPLVEAIVAAGKLSDPAAARYLVNAIMVRRAKIGHTYLESLTALDELKVDAGIFCAVDLPTFYGLVHGGNVERLDDQGRVIDSKVIARDGRVCLGLPDRDYAVLRLRTRRGAEVRPPIRVHVVNRMRIVGVERVEE
jgi:hypothetical protein